MKFHLFSISYLVFNLLNQVVFSNGIFATSENWTIAQLDSANTAKQITSLSQVEKDAIMFINLARLYPKQFADIELKGYNGTIDYGDIYANCEEKKSLDRHLRSERAVQVLRFDPVLQEDAVCFAKESGEKGIVGHDRKACPKGKYAECCSYGMQSGKDIAMQWLIDKDVPSLGHRKNCLDPRFTKVGLSVYSHKKWKYCAVAEFIW